jgi:hypothetical protein
MTQKLNIPLKLSQNKQPRGLWGLQWAHPRPSTPSHIHPLILRQFWEDFEDNFGLILDQF